MTFDLPHHEGRIQTTVGLAPRLVLELIALVDEPLPALLTRKDRDLHAICGQPLPQSLGSEDDLFSIPSDHEGSHVRRLSRGEVEL